MHVGIDCSCLAKPERTGVARYCAALLRSMPGALAEDERMTLMYRLSRVGKRKWFESVDDPRFRTALFDDRVPGAAPRRLDVVHGPDLRMPRLRRIPAVSTVHDLSALDLPGIARESFKERKREALADVARRASVILCISPFTEQSFLARHPEADGRTRIVPLGLPSRFVVQDAAAVADVRRRHGLADRFLLFVGQIAARKNLHPLLTAFESLHGAPGLEDVQLVLVGPVQTAGAEIVDRAEASTAADRIRFLGFVGDEDLPALYTAASVFTFTGKGEGFGLPLLEAMACGCPVVAVTAGATASTAGDAALLVDPDDPAELTEALRSVLENASLAADLREKGFRRAAGFSWEETARRTVAAYRDALRLGVPA